MTQTFIVEATYTDTGWWVLEAMPPGCVSQVRRLDQVEDDMREPIAFLADIPEDEVRIEVKTILPPELEAEVNETVAVFRAKEEAITRAREQSRHAVQALAATGLTRRDIGTLLGITHQRVSQLANA